MSKLLLNLRNVPDEEIDGVRAFLEANAIEFYETTPSRWGISYGGIWVRHDRDHAEAKRLMADFQAQWRARVRAEQAQAERDGTAQTFADIVRTQPLRVALTVLAILVMFGLLALPGWLLMR